MPRVGNCVVAVLAACTSGCGDAPSSSDDGATAASARPAAPVGDAAPEARLADATRLLEVDRRFVEASRLFRALADDVSAPTALRERARIGAARAERMLGHDDAATRLLREAIARGADLPAVRDLAETELTALGGARTRFLLDTAELADGQCLDLDSGGVFPRPDLPQGGRAEIQRSGENLVWHVPHDEVAGGPHPLPWIADAPWWTCRTDAGRTAWIQELPGDRPGVVRFLLRVAGAGDLLPAPRGLAASGRPGTILVTFDSDSRYARWRIERRSGPDGSFEAHGEVAAPPYEDVGVADGQRYGYRVTGITASGDEGVPGLLQASTLSCGVIRGTIDLEGGRGDVGVDLVREEVVPKGGDILFHTSYGSGSSVGLLDSTGRVLVTAGRESPRTPWTIREAVPHPQEIGAGSWVILPLRGGGVARCRVLPRGTWKLRLEYEVDPDHDAFEEGPRLEATDRGDAVEIRVLPTSERTKVDAVSAVDSEGSRRDLRVADGLAVDRELAPGAQCTYEAAGIDALGRGTVRGVVSVDRRPDTPVTGEFRIHYLQGWSFDRGAVAGADEADVYFMSCAGGISSVTFSAPGGIASLEQVVTKDTMAPSAGRLVEGILAAVPDELRLRDDASGDDRTPESDVFVLRTRRGGWVRMAVVERGDEGPWTEKPVTVKFAWNPKAPRFADVGADATRIAGLILAPEAVPASIRSRASKDAIVVDGPARQRGLRAEEATPGAAGGIVPPSGSSQEVLLALERFRDLDKATYVFGTGRDEPGSARPTSAADLVYGRVGDLIEVRPGASDRTVVADLGALTWEDVARDDALVAVLTTSPRRRVLASFGHVYVLCLGDAKLDPVFVRVTGLLPGERVAFESVASDETTLRTSPGLPMSQPLGEALTKFVAAARERLRGGFIGEMPRAGPARDTWNRLESAGYIAVGHGVTLRKALMNAKFEIDPAVAEVCDRVEVEFDSPQPLASTRYLDALTRQAHVGWTITDAGAVRIVPYPTGR